MQSKILFTLVQLDYPRLKFWKSVLYQFNLVKTRLYWYTAIGAELRTKSCYHTMERRDIHHLCGISYLHEKYFISYCLKFILYDGVQLCMFSSNCSNNTDLLESVDVFSIDIAHWAQVSNSVQQPGKVVCTMETDHVAFTVVWNRCTKFSDNW